MGIDRIVVPSPPQCAQREHPDAMDVPGSGTHAWSPSATHWRPSHASFNSLMVKYYTFPDIIWHTTKQVKLIIFNFNGHRTSAERLFICVII